MLKARVTRLRQLTPGQLQRIDALRHAARLLDSAFTVPGTGYRVGLDPIVGLVPWLGDMLSPLFTIAVIWQGRDIGIPKVVQLRMVVNVAIDTLAGLVPFAGDLFDFVWKANERNLRLLEQHAYEERAAGPGDWMFVMATIAVLIALAALPIFVLGWLIALLGQFLASAS